MPLKINFKKVPKALKIVTGILAIILAAAFIVRQIPVNEIELSYSTRDISSKAIALTFDDGPGKYTPRLLDILNEHEAKATFFVTGKNTEKYPQYVKRAFDEGHLIGNHTYNHIDFYKSTFDEVKNSITMGEEAIEKAIGEKPIFLRAPYGNATTIQLKLLDRAFVQWSVSSLDWLIEDSDFVYERILSTAKDGAIILLHDTRKTTIDAVERAIPELQEQGYELVRVDELLTRNGDTIKSGKLYKSCKADF